MKYFQRFLLRFHYVCLQVFTQFLYVIRTFFSDVQILTMEKAIKVRLREQKTSQVVSVYTWTFTHPFTMRTKRKKPAENLSISTYMKNQKTELKRSIIKLPE